MQNKMSVMIECLIKFRTVDVAEDCVVMGEKPLAHLSENAPEAAGSGPAPGKKPL